VRHNQISNCNSELFLNGLQELGIPIMTDPNNGASAGGMLIPNSLNPDNRTRSSARIDYFDGFIDTRPNLHVASGQLVIRLIIDTNPDIIPGNLSPNVSVTGVEVRSLLDLSNPNLIGFG